MSTITIPIPTYEITDWDSFHTIFAEILGFPDFYGRNMHAWIDCMTDADDVDTGMMARAVQKGQMLALKIKDAGDFSTRCPEQFEALVECSDFVNSRRVEMGNAPVLVLQLDGN